MQRKFDAIAMLGNTLVMSLAETPRARLLLACEWRKVVAGDILFAPGQEIVHAHLPIGPVIVSFLVDMEDGNCVETAMVGSEGAVGGIVSHGFLPAFSRAIVQYPGIVAVLPLHRLEALKRANPAIDALFARYADCLLAQIFQASACAATHSIAARIARWLVHAQDRTGDRTIPITQQRLADIIGVGRSYIARVIADFSNRGLIVPSRGMLRIVELRALRKRGCRCDAMVAQHFAAVLG